MTARRLVALARKDLSLAWRSLAWFSVLLGGLLLIFRLRAPMESSAHQVVAFVLVPGQYLTAVVAQALIDRERSRGTFALLRTMPVSDGLIIASKFGLALVLNLAGALIFAALLAPALFASASTLAPVALAALFVAGFGHVVLAGWLITGGRTGAAMPFLAIAALVLGFLGLREILPGWMLSGLTGRAQYGLGAAACIGMSAGAWLTALAWYRRRDTAELIG